MRCGRLPRRAATAQAKPRKTCGLDDKRHKLDALLGKVSSRWEAVTAKSNATRQRQEGRHPLAAGGQTACPPDAEPSGRPGPAQRMPLGAFPPATHGGLSTASRIGHEVSAAASGTHNRTRSARRPAACGPVGRLGVQRRQSSADLLFRTTDGFFRSC